MWPTRPLTEAESHLLRSVVSAREPELARLADGATRGTLSDQERELLFEVVQAELLECELDEQWQPTRRGLDLEDLGDVLLGNLQRSATRSEPER